VVNAAAYADLRIWSIAVNKELTRIGATAVATGWHGGPPFDPTARDSSTIRLTGKKLVDELLTVARTNGLGMELHAVNGKGWMAEAHDET